MADRIRLGFIGANVRATWAAQSHFPALLASPDVELTAVCTTRRETAEAAREASGAKLAFPDFREMVVSKEIDAVDGSRNNRLCLAVKPIGTSIPKRRAKRYPGTTMWSKPSA